MGLRQLGEQHLVRPGFEDRPAEDDCAFPLRDIPVAGAATRARERLHLSLGDHRATFSVAAFSLAPDQEASRAIRSAVARLATFLCKFSGQWRSFSLRGAAAPR